MSSNLGAPQTDLALHYPNGTMLVRIGDVTISPGARLLIKGRSGAGKSTFLRALAGLWPYGQGSVVHPAAAKIYFLPQRSYMPDGTLAALMAYPQAPEAHTDETYGVLLDRLGLQSYRSRLGEYANWRRILSPGEQQRIAAVRAILNAPDYLFVDEATSALDLHSEASFYSLLDERLPRTAIISVAHRQTVEHFHKSIMEIVDGEAVFRPVPTA